MITDTISAYCAGNGQTIIPNFWRILIQATNCIAACLILAFCPGCTTSRFSVLNNSGYTLSVYRDGHYIGDIKTGELLPLKGAVFERRIAVTVVGRNESLAPVGAETWIYDVCVPEVWIVSKLRMTPR